MQCYLCRQHSRLFIHKNGYDIYVCSACGLKQTKLSEPTEQFIKRYYDKGYFTGNLERVAYVSYQGDQWCIRKNAQKYLEIICRYKSNGKLLDIGCAYGYFLETAQLKGFEIVGIDPSEHAVKEARKRIDQVHLGTLDAVKLKANQFDVISLLDVFEHLPDPAVTLQQIYTLLKPGGIVLIATGDTNSGLAKLQGRRWTFYIPPQHLFFLNRQTLETILTKSHLKPLSWTGVGKWVSLRYVLHLAKTTGESRIAAMLEPWVLRCGLGRLPLYLPVGDNLVVIAQKSEK